MVRTKADAYTKAAVKAPRKQHILSGGSSNSPKSGRNAKNSGGNSYCPRPVPEWQKPITSFFSQPEEGESSGTQKNSEECENVSTETVTCSDVNDSEKISPTDDEVGEASATNEPDSCQKDNDEVNVS